MGLIPYTPKAPQQDTQLNEVRKTHVDCLGTPIHPYISLRKKRADPVFHEQDENHPVPHESKVLLTGRWNTQTEAEKNEHPKVGPHFVDPILEEGNHHHPSLPGQRHCLWLQHNVAEVCQLWQHHNRARALTNYLSDHNPSLLILQEAMIEEILWCVCSTVLCWGQHPHYSPIPIIYSVEGNCFPLTACQANWKASSMASLLPYLSFCLGYCQSCTLLGLLVQLFHVLKSSFSNQGSDPHILHLLSNLWFLCCRMHNQTGFISSVWM